MKLNRPGGSSSLFIVAARFERRCIGSHPVERRIRSWAANIACMVVRHNTYPIYVRRQGRPVCEGEGCADRDGRMHWRDRKVQLLHVMAL